jgi:Tfp pilus assembly protein PilN
VCKKVAPVIGKALGFRWRSERCCDDTRRRVFFIAFLVDVVEYPSLALELFYPVENSSGGNSLRLKGGFFDLLIIQDPERRQERG